MKHVLTLLLAAFITTTLWGQKLQHESEKFDVYFGPKQERELRTSVNFFLGADDEEFYTYFRKKNDVTYGKYSNELKKIKTNSVELPKEKVVRNTEFHIELGEEIYELYSISDKKAKSNKLYARTINKESLTPNKDEKELFSLTGDLFYKNFAYAFTQGDVSPDGSKFLVAFKLPEEEDKYRRFRLMVFDRQFNLLWQTDRKFVIDKKLKFNFHGEGWLMSGSYDAFQLGNDGQILTWGIQDKGKDFDKEDRFETYVFKITEKDMVHARVGFSEKKIMESMIRLNNDGKVMISGFYNNNMKAKYDLIDGAFLSYWDIEKGEATHVSYDEFSEEFKQSYWSDRKIAKYEKQEKKKKGKEKVGMSNYKLQRVIEKEDGGAILVGEVDYYYIVYTSKSSYTVYVNGNIIVINVDPNGEIAWSKKIPKSQSNRGNVGLGYELAWTKDRLYFLYNDNFKNLEKGWDGSKVHTFKAGDNPVTMAICDIANDGEITREQVWTTEKAGGMFQPGPKVDQLFDDETIIYIQGGRGTQRMIRVEYK